METLADATVMVAGGVPESTVDHARRVAQVAIELQKSLGEIKKSMDFNKDQLGIRIGMEDILPIVIKLILSHTISRQEGLMHIPTQNCLKANKHMFCNKKLWYRSGTVNSNTVNSKFHLIQSFFEILARILSFHV